MSLPSIEDTTLVMLLMMLDMTPKGVQCPRESVDISVKPPAHPCYNIYVTLSIVMYSIIRNHPGITMLQVMDYAVKRFHNDLMSQKLRKRQWMTKSTNNNAISLQA